MKNRKSLNFLEIFLRFDIIKNFDVIKFENRFGKFSNGNFLNLMRNILFPWENNTKIIFRVFHVSLEIINE